MAHGNLPSKGQRLIIRQNVLLLVCGTSTILFIWFAFGPIPEGIVRHISRVKLALKFGKIVPDEEPGNTTVDGTEESAATYPLSDDNFVVKTEQCQIPNFDPYDASVKDMVERLDPMDCSSDYPNLTFSKVTTSAIILCFNAACGFGMGLFQADVVVPQELFGLAVMFTLLYVSYVCCCCMATRLWMMYFSETFKMYLSCMRRTLEQGLRSRSIHDNRKIDLVDQTRTHLTQLKTCSELASQILGPSLLYAYAYSVGVLCAAAYYTIIPATSVKTRLFFIGYGIVHWFSILLPTAAANQVKDEVTDLQGAVHSIPMVEFSDDLLAQLRMMLTTVRPEELRFTGCGFFVVSLSTFADIMGAVITYTVVLVQTNDNYIKGSTSSASLNRTLSAN